MCGLSPTTKVTILVSAPMCGFVPVNTTGMSSEEWTEYVVTCKKIARMKSDGTCLLNRMQGLSRSADGSCVRFHGCEPSRGVECTLDTHDPNKHGDVNMPCRRSHVHWDSTLQPSSQDTTLPELRSLASAKKVPRLHRPWILTVTIHVVRLVDPYHYRYHVNETVRVRINLTDCFDIYT